MDKDTRLAWAVENMVLELADEQQEMTRSDFQARCAVVARQIIRKVREQV